LRCEVTSGRFEPHRPHNLASTRPEFLHQSSKFIQTALPFDASGFCRLSMSRHFVSRNTRMSGRVCTRHCRLALK
jgi:hypothetical protein